MKKVYRWTIGVSIILIILAVGIGGYFILQSTLLESRDANIGDFIKNINLGR